MSEEKKIIPATGEGERAGALIPKSDRELLIDNMRNLSKQQIEDQQKQIHKPIQIKRKTLADHLRRDTTAVRLLQTAAASYDAELNKYNVGFQQATMA